MSDKPSALRPTAGKRQQQLQDMLSDDSGVVRVNFDVPKALHKRLKRYALERDTTIKDLLIEHIRSLPLE